MGFLGFFSPPSSTQPATWTSLCSMTGSPGTWTSKSSTSEYHPGGKNGNNLGQGDVLHREEAKPCSNSPSSHSAACSPQCLGTTTGKWLPWWKASVASTVLSTKPRLCWQPLQIFCSKYWLTKWFCSAMAGKRRPGSHFKSMSTERSNLEFI